MKRILAITLPVVAALGILFLILHLQTSNANKDMASKVTSFEMMMEDDAYETNDLKQEWESTKSSMGNAKTDYQKELHTRMDFYLEQLRNKSLRAKNEELKAMEKTTEATQDENTEKLDELLAKNRETEKLLEQKQAELEKKEEDFKAREEALERKIKQQASRTSTIKNRLGKSAAELREINKKMWKNEIRYKANYVLVSKRKFKEAEILIKVEEQDYPKHEKWFEAKFQEIKDLDRLYNALTMSGSKYADIDITEGKLKSILADKVTYIKKNEDDEEEEVEEDWYNLDPESHVSIATAVFPEAKEPQIRAYLHLLSGRVVNAAEIYKDPETKAICHAVCDYKMKNIRRLYILNVIKARDEAKDFLKELSASEEISEKYKTQLKKTLLGRIILMSLKEAENRLKEILLGYESLAVAVSGGTDSTLLAKVASEIIPQDKLVLAHAILPFSPKRETAFIKEWTESIGVPLQTMELDLLKYEDVKRNDSKRCYYCKHKIMGQLMANMKEQGIQTIADGTLTDDYGDYRPGLEATAELGIQHPLADAGFDKRMTRLLARRMGLSNWNTPASACLASRIPCDTPIDMEALKKVGEAEDFLYDAGFAGSRVRALTNNIACVEVNPIHLSRLFRKRKEISDSLKKIGFRKVTMDMNGYKQGAMNK